MSKEKKDRYVSAMIALCCFSIVAVIAIVYDAKPNSYVETFIVILTSVGGSMALSAVFPANKVRTWFDRVVVPAAQQARDEAELRELEKGRWPYG